MKEANPPRGAGARAVAAGLVLTVAVGLASADAERGVLAVNGDKLGAEITSEDDVDAFTLELGAGGQLRADARAGRDGDLLPVLRLFDPDGVERSLDGLVKGEGSSRALLKKYVVPDAATGVWTLAVASGGGTGSYVASFRIKNPTKAKVKGVPVPAGGTAVVELPARSDALLSLVVKNKGDGEIEDVRVVGPGGTVHYALADFQAKGSSLKLKKAPLTDGFGAYRLEIDGAGASGLVDVLAKIKLPRDARRRVTLAPEATLDSADPPVARQGDVSLVIGLSGADFAPGATAELAGEGVTLVGFDVVSGTGATLTLDVAADAPYGPRDLTLVPPVLDGEPVTFPAAFEIHAPIPTVTAANPVRVQQDAGATVVEVSGTGFRDGGVLDVSGDDLTVGTTTRVSDVLARVSVTAAGDAAVGARDVSWTQPAEGGGAVGTGAGILAVHAPTPVVTSVSPDFLRLGDASQTLTVTGTGFRPGGVLSFAGSGLTVGSTTVVDATTATVGVTVSGGAALGDRQVTFTQAAASGGDAGSASDVFMVRPPLPTLSSISPTTLRQGDTAVTVTLTGGSFQAGGSVSVGGAGVTASNPTFVSSTTFRADLTVAADADLGLHDVTYAQPVAGGGESVTLTDALTIDAPVPTVASASPAFVRQGAGATTVTITGTGFRDGGALSVSGSGLTVGSTTVVSDTTATVSVTAVADAAVGARDVAFTQAGGVGGASGTGDGVLAVRYPLPTVTSISPTSVTQGDAEVTFTVTGTGFRDGGAVASPGGGLTFVDPAVQSSTTVEVVLNVDSGADLGPQDIVFTQPADGGGDAGTLADALQVNAPAPTITNVSPAALRQGATSQVVTVTGTGFRSGGALSISGSGLTLGSTTVVGPTQATVSVSVTGDATVGTRDVAFTQPALGGGASATAEDALDVQYPSPTISDVTPASARRGDSGTFTLTGTGFRDGGTVTTDNDGVTLSNPTRVSDTSFEVDYSIDAEAPLGKADLAYTQPSSPGGGASVTATDAYEVLTQGPTLTSMAPDRMVPGTTRVPLILTGTNYATGTAVSFSGTGVTVHSTTIDSATQITLEVSVASSASLGTRDVTITPSSGAASTFDGAFRVIPADPTVTSFSHATLAQGASSISVTVRGTNFRSGATLAASGSGVSFSSVSVSDESTITATAAVTSGATAGLRSLTVAHATSDGGGADTLADAFSVITASPSVTSANPAKIAVTGSSGPTRIVPVTLTGTSFMTGATVSVSQASGSGLSVVSGSVRVASATSLTFDLSVAGSATTGSWDVRVTNPGSLGNSGSSGNGALSIQSASTLTVNRVLSVDPLPHGGERVTVHGGGFSAGDVVDFGSQRGHLCQVIDQNTLIVTVAQPASTSPTSKTVVNVKVTTSGGSSATLNSGYAYPVDDVLLVVDSVFPAQGATGVPTSLKSACVRMTAPLDTSTVSYGSTAASNVFWFEAGSFSVSNGTRGFGPQNRWLVFSRTSSSPLAINNAGLYVLNLPTAAKSVGGNAFVPTRIASTTFDQRSFTVTSSSDSTAPTVLRTPANNATGVSTTGSVKLVFSEEIDPQLITSSTCQLTTGGANPVTVPTTLVLDDDLRTVFLHPHTELASSTTYSLVLASTIADLHGNTLSGSTTTFTTGSSTDSTNPTIDSVVIEELPSSLDGSTTYVANNDTDSQGNLNTAGSNTAFDLLTARTGLELVVTYSDDGGAGIDPTSFSAKCSVAVGGSSANAELASKFDVTSTSARWRIGSSDTITAGDNVTFTFSIKDLSSNQSSTTTITIDVLALSTSTNGNGTGDLDPFNARDPWVLRTDVDAYTPTFTTTSNPAAQGATTTRQSDNVPDFAQALRLIGLNTGSPTSDAAAATNGNDTGTNAIMRRLVAERIREIVRERFEIDEDGTRDDGSVDIEFLLAGEQGSLTSLPTYASAPSANASTAHNEMSLGGTDGAETDAYNPSGTLGRATYDVRNSRRQHNLDDGSASFPVGIHMIGMMKLRVNGTSDDFANKVSSVFVTVHGGTPVGEHASDDDVLGGSFDRTTSSNSTHNARYDAIYDAVEVVALYVSSVVAHEVGHSLGLAPDGAPKTGLFGWAHRNNSFTEATSTSPNTSAHMDYGSPRNIMSPTVSFGASVRTGSEFMRFNPLYLAHLRRHILYDEGR